ncbi:MAG: hypothetical protein ACI86M_003054 [Saprospiraceae bacterium]|jgi:hypothetical protein
MKTLKTLLFVFALVASYSISAQVAVSIDGSSADGSAMLDVKSSNKGFLPPRMTAAEIGNIVSPANGLMVYNTDDEKVYIFVSTGNAWKELNYGAGTIPAYMPPPVVGDCLVDGVVFYILQPGDADYIAGFTHGLVVSLDEGFGDWGCFETDLTNVPNVTSSPTDPETAFGASIGHGDWLNTDGIVEECPSGYAADWCRGKGPEWFLPSRGELNELYKWYSTDKPGNNNLIVNCGGVGFASDSYWSSTEFDGGDAWDQDFFSGNQNPFLKDYIIGNVRAVRAF